MAQSKLRNAGRWNEPQAVAIIQADHCELHGTQASLTRWLWQPKGCTNLLTRTKDLSTGASVWTGYSAPAIQTEKLIADTKADVVVIGAGVSGAMVAEELSEVGFSVVVLDRRKPLMGSTSASTALLQYDIDTPLTVLAKQIGLDDAARAWRRSKLGLESLAPMRSCSPAFRLSER